MDFAVGGDSSVTVEAAAVEPSSAVATRSFSEASVALGGEVVVTIAANYGQAGGVTETLPDGFTYESSDLDTSQVTVTGREVRFTLQGDTSFTYTVTASRTTGFSQLLRNT